MRAVMGELNGVRLLELMQAATGRCHRVTATVAYATDNNPFLEYCIDHGILVEFIGLLDEDEAVALPVLQRLLRAGPLKVNARVVKGHFHSKIIWWHGFGAYIGSANLTHSAWFSNVECGVFLEEGEILGTSLQMDLELQFDYLRSQSVPVTTELLEALSKLASVNAAAYRAKQNAASQFQLVTHGIARHLGLAGYGPPTQTTAFTRFTAEWNKTLELLRGLSREFSKLGLRPHWVSPEADPTVHFDQFLHAYYYVRLREDREVEDSRRSADLVNQAFERHRHEPAAALREAAHWWASLDEAPYGEAVFIGETTPWLRKMFGPERMAAWTLSEFQQVLFEVHAFKTHARQVRNTDFGLPKDHQESARDRSDRLAKWLWEQPREATQNHVLELLQHLLWGTQPASMVERLWNVTTDDAWRYDHLGPSSLGEAIGWARPDRYPPRNNRTNKALRSLGHDVRLFSE